MEHTASVKGVVPLRVKLYSKDHLLSSRNQGSQRVITTTGRLRETLLTMVWAGRDSTIVIPPAYQDYRSPVYDVNSPLPRVGFYGVNAARLLLPNKDSIQKFFFARGSLVIADCPHYAIAFSYRKPIGIRYGNTWVLDNEKTSATTSSHLHKLRQYIAALGEQYLDTIPSPNQKYIKEFSFEPVPLVSPIARHVWGTELANSIRRGFLKRRGDGSSEDPDCLLGLERMPGYQAWAADLDTGKSAISIKLIYLSHKIERAEALVSHLEKSKNNSSHHSTVAAIERVLVEAREILTNLRRLRVRSNLPNWAKGELWQR